MTEAPGRILIIRPSALGDVCRSVPVLVSLRRAFPQARIEWLVQDAFVDAVRAHPMLDAPVGFPRRELHGFWKPSVAMRAVRWMDQALRAPGYGLVIDCQGLARSGLFAWWTRAPRRVGFTDAAERGWLGYNRRHSRGSSRHVVDQMLHLLECEGIAPVRDMRLYAPSDELEWWRQERERRGIAARYAVFAPTSRWPSKQWPAEHWRALVPAALEAGCGQVLFVGAGSEREAVRAAMPTDPALAARCVDLAGATRVGGLMAVIAGAAGVVANDSAALHMAVGFARPFVAVFGPTDPAENGPYGGERWVLKGDFAECEPPLHYRDARLGDRLMRRVPPAAVAAMLARALDAGAVEAGAA
ncbi:MAG: glycosyltransferase family 9 protein [Phycisphaerales bacterium]